MIGQEQEYMNIMDEKYNFSLLFLNEEVEKIIHLLKENYIYIALKINEYIEEYFSNPINAYYEYKIENIYDEKLILNKFYSLNMYLNKADICYALNKEYDYKCLPKDYIDKIYDEIRGFQYLHSENTIRKEKKIFKDILHNYSSINDVKILLLKLEKSNIKLKEVTDFISFCEIEIKKKKIKQLLDSNVI